ncbi:MAG: ankyrin repeat domain-containing protein [Kofleriaceae bacterium]
MPTTSDLDALWSASGRSECSVSGAALDAVRTLDPKVATKRAKLVSALIANGSSATAASPRDLNRTALHYAAATGNLPVIDVLLAAGASPTQKDSAGPGYTPFDYALAAGIEPARRLLAAGATLDHSRIGTHATPALLDALTKAGAVLTPAVVRDIANSALNSRDGKLAVLKWLAAHGADLSPVLDDKFNGKRNAAAMTYIASLAKPAPKRPVAIDEDLPALVELGTQLGIAAKKAADDNGDLAYYRREKDLDPTKLPGDYWRSRFEEQARTLMRKSPTLAKLDERTALQPVHAAYLASWRAPVSTPQKSFAKPRHTRAPAGSRRAQRSRPDSK